MHFKSILLVLLLYLRGFKKQSIGLFNVGSSMFDVGTDSVGLGTLRHIATVFIPINLFEPELCNRFA